MFNSFLKKKKTGLMLILVLGVLFSLVGFITLTKDASLA